MENPRRFLARVLAASLTVLLTGQLWAYEVRLPAGTAVYGELQEAVTSKKTDTAVGEVVRAQVWRDVLVDGRVAIHAGAPMITRVSMVKPAKIAGRRGEVHVEAVSVRAVDGSEILLDGGYDKSGKGKKALAWSLFALVAWPLVFIKGKQAVLEPGTVFDAAIQADTDVAVDEGAGFRIRVGSPQPPLEVAVLYDDMDPEAKQQVLPLELRNCAGDVGPASIVAVNGKEIPSIPLALGSPTTRDGCSVVRGSADLKALAKHFSKGINRFEVASGDALAEVILEIEL